LTFRWVQALSTTGRGNLVIRARADAGGFTSARLVTKGLAEFRYGRIAWRALARLR
jgi:beta-glucanase (GH16 family)